MCTVVDPFTHARSSHCVKPPLTADGCDWLPLGDVDRSSRLTSVHPGLSQPPDWMGLSRSSSSYLLKTSIFFPPLRSCNTLQTNWRKNVQPGSTLDAVLLSSLSQELQTFFNWFIFVFQMKRFGLLFFEAWLSNPPPHPTHPTPSSDWNTAWMLRVCVEAITKVILVLAGWS